MTRISKAVVAVVVLVLTSGATVAETADANPARSFLPFPPDVVTSCGSFAVGVTALVDKEYQTVIPLVDGGELIRVTGDLVLQLTNLTSAKSVIAKSSGPYSVTTHPDGSGVFESLGLGVNCLGPDLAAQFDVPAIAQTAGRVVITFDASNTVTGLTTVGRVTDLCAELSEP